MRNIIKPKRQKIFCQSGFTLVELLVAVGVMVVLATASINLLFTTLRGTNKDKVISTVKSNGDYLTTRFESMLRFSNGLVDNGLGEVCEDSMSALGFESYDGGQTILSLNGTQVASNSSLMTGSDVEVRNLVFRCKKDSFGTPLYVELEALVGTGNASVDRPEDLFEQTFRTGVSLRSY